MLRALSLTAVTLAALLGAVLQTNIATADDTYTVKDGDSLLAIAVKAGVPGENVLDWVATAVTLNNLVDADSITTGQVLKLPNAERNAALVAGAAPAAAAGGTYTVKDGDTLLGIASVLKVPAAQQLEWVNKLLALNGITSVEKLLAIGQVLKLPGSEATVTTQATSATSPAPQTATPSTTASSATAPTSTTSTSTSTQTVSQPGVLAGSATAYADYFQGRNMGCKGAGPYSAGDLTVIAVGPAMHEQFPCGTPIEVCGVKGCITGIRKDSCPGCTAYHVDLSRAGFTAVCGVQVCSVRIRRAG